MLHEWAVKHGVSLQALQELQLFMGTLGLNEIRAEEISLSESAVQTNRRLKASREGGVLWRNQSGALYNDDRRLVRYGLCNDSTKINKVLKSSDLIGINPILIGPEHIGQTIGQFDAEECKHGGWRYSGTDEEKAQLNFINVVIGLGGRARFVNNSNMC